ncbi:MAG: helix-turn-helix domain-containing protein [Treponema sp.]|jgi:antitoxin HicB|nr:helix-turn-helix domain-containing protein [Treponema sp.]
MKITVPCKITFSPTDKCWYVESPGLYNGILTDGDTLEQAKEMASEAVSGIIAVNLKHDISFSIPACVNIPDYYDIPLVPELAFAFWLRSTRKNYNMTLSDVAERLGVKYQVYQKLENPKTANPTLKTLKKLERIFNTNLISI